MLAYLEDAPADNGSAVRGLSKAVVPLLRCIDGEFACYFVHQTHIRLPTNGMPTFVREKLVEGHTQGRLAHNAWKLATVLPLSMGLALASFFTPRPTKGPLPTGTACLWAPIGIDPGTLVRAWCLARRMGLPLSLYFVDDIETHPSNAGTRRLSCLIAKIVRDATRVYTITEELGALFTQRYGIKAWRLPLIPEFSKFTTRHPSAAAQSTPAIFAAYLGSINHLYEEGLRHLIKVVQKLRNTTGQDLQLRFISELADVRRVCGGDIPPWIAAGPEADEAEVRRYIETASLCFLPHSFQESARTMVSTSFPSKLLDYLIGARAIVVFAPDYSIAHKTLSGSGAPHVVSTPEALASVLALLATCNEMNQDIYHSLLAQYFGPDSVKSALSAP